ncbi:MAG: acyl-ACP--UDP-N-acetylglucosamine O-acyltransferase [Deltaproteobacteria bacterium]|nr:acyl-ACP--UDP-N-acetylglucosamine O-acyltransferase [Deltaproteobacteria bacterium]
MSRTASKIHASAIIHPEAQIHESCEIGPFCKVGPAVKVGAGNRLLSHVVIENRTTIGENNVFHPFGIIGGEPQDLKYEGEPTELVIGNGNTIRESVTLNIGTKGGGGVTRVGDGNLLMAYVHLGHDTVVGSHTVIANSCQIAGHVVVEDWAIIGGLCGVSQFLRIGTHCYIGGGSGIERNVPPFTFGKGATGSYENLGMNLVGLKRRGFDDQAIAALREVDKLYIKDKSLEKEIVLKKIEEALGSVSVVQQFVKFVRASEKGVYR